MIGFFSLFIGLLTIFDGVSSNVVSALATMISSLVAIVTGYIMIRERVLKSEIKIDNVYGYIDGRNELLDSKIKELQQDIYDFKEINKETSKSLNENTAAIRELKFVLSILQEQLITVKKPTRNSNNS